VFVIYICLTFSLLNFHIACNCLGAAKEVKSLFAGDPSSYGGVLFLSFHFTFPPIYFPSGFFLLFSLGIIMMGRRLGQVAVYRMPVLRRHLFLPYTPLLIGLLNGSARGFFPGWSLGLKSAGS